LIRRENLRNGFRRLSIVTGILGAIIGGGNLFVNSKGVSMPVMIGVLIGGTIGWAGVFGPYWVALGFLGDGLKKPQRDDEVV
jgi:hypothetical protein